MTETKMPEPGETWQTTQWGVVTVKEVRGGVWYCSGQNGESLSFGYVESFLSRASPAQPDEPEVGETWETNTISLPRQMTITRIGRDEDYPYIYEEGNGVTASYCRRQLTRRLSPQPTGEGPSVAEPVATPTPKADPYETHRAELLEKHGFENDLHVRHQTDAEQYPAFLKRKAREAQALRDFDRPLLKLGGRFGKRVEMTHPAAWPEADEGEP